MSKHLNIGGGLRLPLEAVTQTFAILAKRGMGKTYAALVLVEELLKAGLPVVVADPVGVCWGLRASADGRGPGLPIVVLGGEHGDVPLEPTAGRAVAELVIADRLSAVLDLSLMRKGEQVRFMTDFAEALYHGNREPLHLLLDEADAFAPQRPMKGQERMLGAVEDLVRRGRARGIGITLVTQRPAVLNKNVLTQIEVLVALRTIAPQDRAALDEWIRVHGTPEQRDELLRSLPSLDVGTAWFWSPGWLDEFRKVAVRRRETFDSSATPKAGAARPAPRALAAVDVERVREQLAESIERAEAQDPKALARRVAELEQELAAARAETRTERVEVAVPVLGAEDLGRLETLVASLRDLSAEAAETARRVAGSVVEAKGLARAALGGQDGNVRMTTTALHGARIPSPEPTPAPAPAAWPESPRAVRPGPPAPQAGGAVRLAKADRLILAALAQYPQGRTKVQVALLTGYSHRGGGFGNAISGLATRGLLERVGDRLVITRKGLATGPYEPLPTGAALVEHWLGQLGRAERLILEALVAAYPKALTKDEVAARTGYEARGGGFGNAISRLRTLELICGRGEIRASQDLMF